MSDQTSNNAGNVFTNAGNVITNTVNKVVNTVNNKLANNNIVNLGDSNPIKNNQFVIGMLIALLVIFMIFYFFSRTFRVSRTLNKVNIYITYQDMKSLRPPVARIGRLADFHVSTAYNCALTGYQMLDYTSTKMIKKVMQAGVRGLVFSVFSNTYGKDAYPVVSSGYKQGEWKLTANTLSFEECINTVANNAFDIYDGDIGTFNSEDPIFIILDIKTENIYTLDRIGQILTNNFKSGNNSLFLDSKYSYQQSNLGEIPMQQLYGKVVIIASGGFRGSKLEELVNYSWDLDKLRNYHHSEINNDDFDKKELIKFNKRNLSIVFPNKEGDFFSSNYNPKIGFNTGCQFVAMNYQRLDSNMDTYITKFQKAGIVPKLRKLRKLRN